MSVRTVIDCRISATLWQNEGSWPGCVNVVTAVDCMCRNKRFARVGGHGDLMEAGVMLTGDPRCLGAKVADKLWGWREMRNASISSV